MGKRVSFSESLRPRHVKRKEDSITLEGPKTFGKKEWEQRDRARLGQP